MGPLQEKSSEASVSPDVIGFAAERLLAMKIETLCGAGLASEAPNELMTQRLL